MIGHSTDTTGFGVGMGNDSRSPPVLHAEMDYYASCQSQLIQCLRRHCPVKADHSTHEVIVSLVQNRFPPLFDRCDVKHVGLLYGSTASG